MATVKVVDLLAKVAVLLSDDGFVRWTAPQLQGWLNDAYRETVNLRPDSNMLVGEFACVAGPRQAITTSFDTASRLVECVRNTAAASNKSRVKLASRSSVDSMRPNWYAETETVNIELYVFDPRTPTEFLVYPPAAATARLEVLYASVPAPHTLTDGQLTSSATAEVIRIGDTFANALLDYVMYRAYATDTEASSMAKASAYYQAFAGGLGTKVQIDAASQPGVA